MRTDLLLGPELDPASELASESQAEAARETACVCNPAPALTRPGLPVAGPGSVNLKSRAAQPRVESTRFSALSASNVILSAAAPASVAPA
eukprot:3522229-Rhodomonas_salina.1